MQHTLHLSESELAKYPQKGYIITKLDPNIQRGDQALLTHERKQVSMMITEVETEHVFKGYCILALIAPGTAMLKDTPEVLPAFSPHERETTDPNY